ncbi:hypothetical protein [Oceanobacillus sojae]|uniref:hypothetical protein n=1 Tax=Oceanobacillus sojae TaxID=582851 RepID=UPI0009887D4D|nr:hypothetical protein [Oceanobacillus sojae]MCT1904893.1 hypothetical protein [Oceanobacillus sojae]
MNRSIEITLTIIGGLFYVFLVGMYMEAIDKAYAESNSMGGLLEGVTIGFGMMGIAIIIGVLASIWFKGDKKAKTASMMLIIFAAVSLFITQGGTFVGAFFYFAAGILGIIRKPKSS